MTRFGLRTRLSISIAVLIAAFAAFFAIYFPRQQERAATQALQQRARSVSTLLGDLAAAAVVAVDLGGAEMLSKDLSQAAGADADINYIIVVKKGGKVIADYQRGTISQAHVQKNETPIWTSQLSVDDLQVAVPLKHEGEQVGTLNMAFSLRGVQSMQSESRRTAILVSSLILFIGLIVGWFIAHRLATPLLGASRRLADVSVVLVDSAREQESTSAQEAAAVAETRRSMETLLDSAQQIADPSGEVLGNAERNTQSSQRIAERIRDLNSLGDKVAEILATIMQVADKADLLALNASLEGTKAGEAGKGFTLVAAEMRRLAESVMESVNGIRRLMKDMQVASQGAASASEDGQDSSSDTANSAREIAKLTQEQRQATEQVIMSMNEMSSVLEHTIATVQRTNEAASDAQRLAGTLFSLVGAVTDSEASETSKSS